MDYTPQKIIAMIRAGFKKEVLTSFTNWLCCSCYSCTVECPKGVKITDIMYALKRCAIQNGIHQPRFAIPILAREFFNSVMKHGRTNESRLTLLLFLKTNPLRLLRQTGLGLKLWRQGRLSYRTESVKNIKQLRRLLKTVERKETVLKGAVQGPITVEAP
jgi:heterodisulfide reductase subunit C